MKYPQIEYVEHLKTQFLLELCLYIVAILKERGIDIGVNDAVLTLSEVLEDAKRGLPK